MKKSTIITLLLFYSFTLFSQQKEIKKFEIDTTKSTFIKLDFYKKVIKKKLSDKDLARIKIIDGDTLVFVKNYKKFRRKTSRIDDAFLYQKRTAYMSLGDYKRIYNITITKEDSLNFQFKEKDTLINITNKDFYKNQKRVDVAYEPKDSTFLETYKDLVYNKYTTNGNIREGEKEYMRLWKNQLKIYFSPSLDDYYQKTIINAVENLSGIDSLKITFIKNLSESNYIIYQIDDKNKFQYSKDLVHNKYVNYYIYWNKGRIYDAKLEINLKNNETIVKEKNAKILEQNFYQTLGRFHNTSKLPCNSIFSNCNSYEKEFTKLDYELIKYHYSYGICKFTDLETFEENHAHAKEIIKKGGNMTFTHVN